MIEFLFQALKLSVFLLRVIKSEFEIKTTVSSFSQIYFLEKVSTEFELLSIVFCKLNYWNSYNVF